MQLHCFPPPCRPPTAACREHVREAEPARAAAVTGTARLGGSEHFTPGQRPRGHPPSAATLPAGLVQKRLEHRAPAQGWAIPSGPAGRSVTRVCLWTSLSHSLLLRLLPWVTVRRAKSQPRRGQRVPGPRESPQAGQTGPRRSSSPWQASGWSSCKCASIFNLSPTVIGKEG